MVNVLDLVNWLSSSIAYFVLLITSLSLRLMPFFILCIFFFLSYKCHLIEMNLTVLSSLNLRVVSNSIIIFSS